MCGIAGVVHADMRKAHGAVRAMNGAQAHRGPDDEGVATLEVGRRSLALGHRRLAILDLSPAGHQPMSNPDTGDVIVYNGELYNYRPLRAELEAAGVRFRTATDTEVILVAFARWGAACLKRFSGMYAFALFEKRSQRLHLARDPLGIKPLYIAPTADSIVFASELRAVMASDLVERRIDRRALASVLAYGAVAGPLTMFEGVCALDPGTHLAIDLGAERIDADRRRASRFFCLNVEARKAPVAHVAAELRPLLRAAVASHLQSDVPVGIFLSRGIDSTAIAALASELRGGDVDTFTVSLADDAEIDEGPAAARSARVLGTRHHDVRIGESEVRPLVARALASVDQPSVDGLNTYVISRAVRERGIVVALSGLGGDEMFGGYSTFRTVPALRRALSALAPVPSFVRQRIARAILSSRTSGRLQKGVELAGTPASLRSVYLRRRRLMSDAEMAALGFASESRDDDFIPEESDAARGLRAGDDWAAVRTLETRFYMGNMLLRDADVFGMAHGLEIRVPLLGQEVVDAALRYTRSAIDWRRGPNKPWLVAALGDRLPREVRGLPKRGFSLPQARWMRTSLREEFEARIDVMAKSGLVDPVGVEAVWQTFLREPESPTWSRAWMLAVVGAWLENGR